MILCDKMAVNRAHRHNTCSTSQFTVFITHTFFTKRDSTHLFYLFFDVQLSLSSTKRKEEAKSCLVSRPKGKIENKKKHFDSKIIMIIEIGHLLQARLIDLFCFFFTGFTSQFFVFSCYTIPQ